MTIGLPSKMRLLLEGVSGETPDQKVAYLLRDAIQRNLEASERERLDLEIKYGLEHEEFKRRLEAGDLGDEFGHELEMDAIRWDDLILEKKHWLQQLNLIRSLS